MLSSNATIIHTDLNVGKLPKLVNTFKIGENVTSEDFLRPFFKKYLTCLTTHKDVFFIVHLADPDLKSMQHRNTFSEINRFA